jgi:hypothetical protein
LTVNPKLVGRCGIYCGYCEVHRAYKGSVSHRVALARKYNCMPGDIVCEGCQALHAKGWSCDPKWGKNCEILECLGDNGYRFCYECPNVDSCAMWRKLAASYLELGINLRYNLQMMKDGKTREWLAEQEKRWRCADCGSELFVREGSLRCPKCTPPESEDRFDDF